MGVHSLHSLPAPVKERASILPYLYIPEPVETGNAFVGGIAQQCGGIHRQTQ